MKKLCLSVLACLSFITITFYSSMTFAGNRAGALTLTPAVGYDFFGSKRHMSSTLLGAVMLGYNFTPHWGIEGLAAGFNTKYNGWIHDNRQIRGTIFSVNGLYHFRPDSEIEPYVLAGAGVMGLNPSHSDANNQGNVNAGGGFQLFVDKSLAFRFELRDIYTMVGGKNDVLATLGVSILLDLCKYA